MSNSPGVTPGCTAPQNLGHRLLQDTTVRLTWASSSCNASGYRIWYRPHSGGAWQWVHKAGGNSVQLNLSGLTPGTKYRWKMKTRCSNGTWSDFTPTQYFTTLATPCVNATGMHTPLVTSTQARPTWTAPASVKKYVLRYRVQGTSAWTYKQKGASWTYHWLTGLSAGTTYEWQISTLCTFSNASATRWSASATFTTTGNAKTSDLAAAVERLNAAIQVLPNPNGGQFVLKLPVMEAPANVRVVDLAGALVYQGQLAGTQQLDLMGVAPGVYVLTVEVDGLTGHQRVVLR